MQGHIRRARPADVPTLVELAELRLEQNEAHQPIFWCKAEASRECQEPSFQERIKSERVIALIHEHRGVVDSFVMAELVTAPPVYTPGGYICEVDDFVVAHPHDWETVGALLLKEACREARRRGAVVASVTADHLDGPLREMLENAGFAIASEWHVKLIAED